MTVVRQRLACLRDEGGYTLMELLTTMIILLTVMTGLTQLLVSGTRAEVDMNRRFQAQTEARLALDRLRKDVHRSCGATVGVGASSVTLSYYDSAGVCGGVATDSITYCVAAAAGGVYDLHRYGGTSCSGASVRVAQQLTTQAAFTYVTPSTSLAKLSVTLSVNLTPANAERVYTLQDDLVLRNSARTA